MNDATVLRTIEERERRWAAWRAHKAACVICREWDPRPGWYEYLERVEGLSRRDRARVPEPSLWAPCEAGVAFRDEYTLAVDTARLAAQRAGWESPSAYLRARGRRTGRRA